MSKRKLNFGFLVRKLLEKNYVIKCLLLIFTAASLLNTAQAKQKIIDKKSEVFKYRIAIVGNPSDPDTRYEDIQLKNLKEEGFNTIQLNIAWGSRPADEPLNLEDILAYEGESPSANVLKRFEEIKRRAKKAKEYGFRTLFQFGAPLIRDLYRTIGDPKEIDSATCANDINDPVIVKRYQYLISQLAEKISEIDDIMIYTMDQEAWLGNEFGNCNSYKGVPIDEKIPPFLKDLSSTWSQSHPKGIMWWEPWELSAGELFAIIDKLPQNNFGLILHSNVAEVQASRPVDTWFRNVVSLASQKGIPVIGEIFMSSSTEEVNPLLNVVTPGLAFRQLAALKSVKNLSGVKEYFGILPVRNDPNLKMTALFFKNPDIDLDDALITLSKEYGKAKNEILNGWKESSFGYSLAPWDATWLYRLICQDEFQKYHSWKAFEIIGQVAHSPDWESTRRSIFMFTKNESLDPWVIEDVGIRFGIAADHLEKSILYYKSGLTLLSDRSLKKDVESWIKDILLLKTIFRDHSLQAMETLAAYNIRRTVEANEKVPGKFYSRLRDFLVKDVENQSELKMPHQDSISAEEKLKEFDQNPDQWVKNNLVYTPAK
jgi:hypothetical protein